MHRFRRIVSRLHVFSLLVLALASGVYSAESLQWSQPRIRHFRGDGRAVAKDSSGRFYVAGRRSNGTDNDLVVLRYTAARVLDTNFNGTGFQIYNGAGNGDDIANSISVDASGNVVVVGTARGATDDDVVIIRLDGAGEFDTTFSGDGVQIYDSGGPDAGNAVAVDGTGQVYVAATVEPGADSDVRVLKYTSAGVLDTTFSGDGIQTYGGAGNADDEGNAIAVDGSGNVFVAGAVDSPSQLLILKYDATGTLAAGWGTGGVVTYASGLDWANGVAISGTDIYVTGSTLNFLDVVPLTQKYDSAGTLGWSTAHPFAGEGRSLVVDGSGNVSVVGLVVDAFFQTDFLALKYDSAGAPDAAFAGGSMTDGSSSADAGRGVVLGSSGEIYTAGVANDGANDYLQLLEIASDGTVADRLSDTGSDSGAAVAVDSDGNAYVATTVGHGNDYDIELRKISAAGELVTEFGTGGVVTLNDAQIDAAAAIAVDGAGSVYLAGVTDNFGFNSDIVVSKLTADGDLDTSFNVTGQQIIDLSNSDVANAVAVDTNGVVYVAGYTLGPGMGYDALVAKIGADGTLDASFDTDGIQTYDGGTGDDYANGVAIGTGSAVLICGTSDTGASADGIVLKYRADGVLDSGFNGSGLQTYGGAGDDSATALKLDSIGRIYVTGVFDSGATNDAVIQRFTALGALDTTFNAMSGGQRLYDSGADDEANSFDFVGSTGIVVVGTTGDAADVWIWRLSIDGALDTGFDADGVATHDSGHGADAAAAVAASNGYFITGTAGTNVWILRYNAPTTPGTPSNPGTTVHAARALPNVLRPARGSNQINFVGAPAGAAIRVYTLTGELVRNLAADSSGEAVWNGANDHGEKAASGVYVVLIEGNGERRTMKVAVQR